MKRKFTLLWIVMIMLVSHQLSAQLLDPDQPEQDACDAILLCGNSFFTPYGYQGTGETIDMPYTPCGSGEASSMWLKVIVTAPGTIVFTLTPVDSIDDYDFAVINATNADCSNLSSSDVIRCQFNNNNQPPLFGAYYYGGIIGLNSTSTILYATAGVNNQEFLQQINANAGDVYLIMVNNYGDDNCTGTCPGSGFTIDFTGSTATFQSQGDPEIDSVVTACEHVNGMQLFFSHPINCASIAGNSDFYLSPSGTISSVIGDNCNANGQGYTNSATLTFNPPLPPGNYTLHPTNGTDGNTLLDLCGGALSQNDTIPFTIWDIPKFQSADIACSTVTLQMNTPVLCNSVTANGSDFQLSGPEPISITNAEPVNCDNDGYTSTIRLTLSGLANNAENYLIKAQNGSDGNTLEGHCDKFQPAGDSITVHANPIMITVLNKENSICTANNGSADIAVTGGEPPYTFLMDTDQNFTNNSHFSDLAPGQHIVYVKDDIGCQYADSFSIQSEIHTLYFSADTLSAACDDNRKGGEITINPTYNNAYIGAIPYTYVWDGHKKNNSNTLTDIPSGSYHVKVTDANGCEGDTTITIGELPCCKLLMPTAFSPNGDGLNDEFKPITNEDIVSYHLSIFNRWGQSVYEGFNAENGWDGNVDGKISNGDVFFYTLSYTCFRGNVEYKSKGEVTLVK